MAFNLSEHRFIYDVAECIGLTENIYDEATYQKIADWVNNDSVLSTIFTTEFYYQNDVIVGVVLKGNENILGLYYGNIIAQNHNDYASIVRNNSSSEVWELKVQTFGKNLYTRTNLLDLQLLIYKGDYGGFVCWASKATGKITRGYVYSRCVGDNGVEKTAVVANVCDYIYSTAYGVATSGINATRNKITPNNVDQLNMNITLQRVIVPDDSEVGFKMKDVFFVYGAALTMGKVYEIDGGFYVIVAENSNGYAGIALRIG